MIIRVKENTYKTWIRKGITYGILVVMFTLYYFHMSSEFQEMNQNLTQELAQKNEILNKKEDVNKKVEKIIYKEAEKCVELLGQEKIRSVEIVKNKLNIVCDYNTNVEAIFIRYGVMALVKSTPEDIKISIDLKFIVESNYEI